MFLRAGAVSLLLLLASRVLGLVRESAQAAALGSSSLADAAVLMLTLPDWLAGVLISGAMAYVLLPEWASRARAEVDRSQARLAAMLAILGVGLASGLWVARDTVLRALAPALFAGGPALAHQGELAMVWSLAALVPALWAALWATRLQHERDFAGLYGANLVVNGVVVLGLLVLALGSLDHALRILGVALMAASGLRLLWLHWRARRCRRAAEKPLQRGQGAAAASSSPPSLWLWAFLIAGLPLALPVAARSLAAQGGEGQLAVFNYAWKLVELPLLLAVQLVATIAFPAVTRAVAEADARVLDGALAQAFALAWALACAAALGLLLAAPAVADLLFGWGRMSPAALAQVADWGRVGALGLLPQALIAVGLTVLAAQARLAAVALAYAAGLLGLAFWGRGQDGATLMAGMNWLLLAVAMSTLGALVHLPAAGGSPGDSDPAQTGLMRARRWLPLRLMAVSGPLLLGAWLLAPHVHGLSPLWQWLVGGGGATASLGVAWALSPALRQALRR